MAPIAREHHSTILSRIKVMSELDIAERRVPQDGRFRVRYKGRLIDFRVCIMPTVHGENAVLRVLDKESMSEKFPNLSLDVVGFAEDDLRRFRRYIREPYGMVLVTGPTGSGKTTTLYAALNEIKSDEDKIITIEDPVEYQIRGITQIPVNEKKGLTFARGLRSILRHDPDKILVGEIRDAETAQIAINSALTGHLVFTTVHANNVVDVLGRFLNMGVEPYNFVSALNCILAQRLVRTICDFCAPRVIYDDERCSTQRPRSRRVARLRFQEGAGCMECAGTGYRGRTAIHELLELDDEIREMLLEKSPAPKSANWREKGMHFLRDSALDRVRAGMTTLKEINKVDIHRGQPLMPRRLRIFPSTSAVTLRPRLAAEITPEGVVAARQENALDSAAVTSFAPLLPGSVLPSLQAPNFPEAGRIVAALRQALDQVVERDRKLTLVIPDAAVRVLLLDFDSLPERLQEALPIIRFRLRKLLAFEVDDSTVSYQVMARAEDQVRVLVTVIPHTILAEYESVVRQAGYEPGAVLPSTLCAVAAVSDTTDALVVNRNASSITSAITRRNELLLHRTLDLPIDAADRAADIQQAVSVAIAYFEDSLSTPLESLFYVGPGGAAELDRVLNDDGDPGVIPVRVRDLVEPPATGAVSPVPVGILAGVTGALAN